MLSNNQNQPKCLKCGMPINESICPSCGFNVMREALLSIDKEWENDRFYNKELTYFIEHKETDYFTWIKAASKNGNTDAQYILGYIYEKGLGVNVDKNKAIKWYQKAAKQGHKEAKEKLSNLTTNNNTNAENNYPTRLKYSEEKVFFGSYYQNDYSKKEPIEWQILEKKGNKVLLISKYALDCKKYNELYTNITWEKCTLRAWLNKTFLEQAFSSEESSKIVKSTVTDDSDPEYIANPGNATTDKIFLLSLSEFIRYFKTKNTRQCQGTKYCFTRGAYRRDSNNIYWWLRSPGYFSYGAKCVDVDGAVQNTKVNYGKYAIRPALWVNLES